MPMVINAHITAAKTEAIWVREERVMLYSFQVGRIGAVSFAGPFRPCMSISTERASFNKYNKNSMMMEISQSYHERNYIQNRK
jgi:hypothetical protein